MPGNQELPADRRHCVRQLVHAPAFASFDGVSGGMILDLSPEGLSMQTGLHVEGQRIEKDRHVRLNLDLDPTTHVETTGYIAWADALGRAGIRFSDLPEDARRRIEEWLASNASSPSYMAPKISVGRPWTPQADAKHSMAKQEDHAAITLIAETATPANGHGRAPSTTMQYEFTPLGNDLGAALRLIGERACCLTRGSSAAIGLVHQGAVMCRASVGEGAPALGMKLDVSRGLSGACFRLGKTVRCDDTENDPRVDLESCRQLGVRSILAAPVRYERDIVGLLMVCAPQPFNFDEGDVAIAESLAHTVVRSMRQAECIGQT
jgi:GAF domain/PilZ domain